MRHHADLLCSNVTNLIRQGNPDFVPRVLEVVKGKICYVIGTVYMEMSLKPNVLDDIARDVSFIYAQRDVLHNFLL